MDVLDAVVVGAGQAGLGIGYCLLEAGHSFVILERGRVGETWRTQRWDSFAVNTPNWANGLPGFPYEGNRPDGFYHRDELIAYFERYTGRLGLPVREGVTVTGVDRSPEGETFMVETAGPPGVAGSIETRNLVVASGIMHTPRIPKIAQRFPQSILQLHTADYRRPENLPPGAIIVVGGGQSGCQIVEDLVRGGRIVYMCTSKVARVPRRYRGRDILEWFSDMGVWDETVDDLEDPGMQYAAQPQVSGVGRYGSTVSLQHLASQGVRLMGRLVDVANGVLTTDDSLADHIAFADERSAQFKADVDAYIEAEGVGAAAPEDDPIDAPAGPEVAAAGLTEVHLAAAGVSTVIWCTGFTASFDWLHLPVVDDAGHPVHHRGVSEVPGVYFLGFPWLHTRKSGVILGIDEDARYLAEVIGRRL